MCIVVARQGKSGWYADVEHGLLDETLAPIGLEPVATVALSRRPSSDVLQAVASTAITLLLHAGDQLREGRDTRITAAGLRY